MFSVPLCNCQGTWLLDCVVKSLFSQEFTKLFSKVAILFCFPTGSEWASVALYLCQHLVVSVFQVWGSAFFIVQLSHPYTTPGEITALTRRTFVVKVMSLLFNMLSRLVITFLPSSKRHLILWLQSLSAATLKPKKKRWADLFLYWIP